MPLALLLLVVVGLLRVVPLLRLVFLLLRLRLLLLLPMQFLQARLLARRTCVCAASSSLRMLSCPACAREARP